MVEMVWLCYGFGLGMSVTTCGSGVKGGPVIADVPKAEAVERRDHKSDHCFSFSVRSPCGIDLDIVVKRTGSGRVCTASEK